MICIELNRIKKARNAAANARNSVFIAYWNKVADHAYRVDRKDNSKGYVSGNVCACCKRCNFSKGDRYTYEEWFIMTRCYRSGRLPRSTVKFGGFGCREQRCKS